jgi:2-polyprenyl-3-methyl-5-hydroxy-6-metoxy-1,4-benzoquinol methylase
MENLTICPICQSTELKEFLECIDYTVSKDKFTIAQCSSCGFHFTNPRPEQTIAGKYYQSEDYISHSDTRKGIINNLYHYARKFTLKKKLKLVTTVSSVPQTPKGALSVTIQSPFRGLGRSLLDLGCGTGAFLNVCKEAGWKVQGIEPSAEAREVAKKNHGLDLYDVNSWGKFQDNSLDVVTAWHVLEHVYKLEDEVCQVKRTLKNNGTFVVALPNCNSADAQFYGPFWAAYDVPRHIWHFTPVNVKLFFEKQGFAIESVLPMPWDAYYICMLSEKYKAGNVNYGRAMIHAWVSNKKAQKSGNTWSSQIYILKPVK